MAVVIVYARHSKKCPKNKVKGAGQYRRCKCPLWLRCGNLKRSAKTRSWEIANKKARLLEEELDQKALGVEAPKNPEPITIEAAAALYLADMVQRGKGIDKPRRMLRRLQDYANANNVILLKDVTARLLTEWRGKWTFKVYSSCPAVHWAVVRTFFGWAFATELILVDPSAKLRCLPYIHNQVYPLSQDEMSRLLAATSECGFVAEVAYRIKVFILLQRWSGLACMDAATLRRDRLLANNNLTRVQRNKTGVQVFVPVPSTVCDALRGLQNDHLDYFFWNPDRMTKRSVVALFGGLLCIVFDKAGVAHGREEMLSHRFRHTFAVEMLLAGVGIEEVSKLLGHKTMRTTERYYSAWVPKRQQKLEAEVKEAWTKMLPVHPIYFPSQPTVQ
jgi:site-specific recombinase XerD